MATKEGAERACANKRPVIDGRRANVDLAYIGAKPKTPKAPQREDAASPECISAPASPTHSEEDAVTDSGTEWVTEEQCSSYSTPQSCHGNYMYNSCPAPAPAPMMLQPVELKPTCVSGIQTVNSNLPLMNTMTYYQGNVPPYSSPGNATSVDPKFLDQTAVNLVTFVPQRTVTTPSQNASLTVQCLPQFGQVPPQPTTTKLIPSARYIYTVPVWYVDQGRVSCGQVSLEPVSGVSCGQVSLEPVSSYSQPPLISGIDGSNNGDFSACKMYPIPTYY